MAGSPIPWTAHTDSLITYCQRVEPLLSNIVTAHRAFFSATELTGATIYDLLPIRSATTG